jgi:hypothetical protein
VPAAAQACFCWGLLRQVLGLLLLLLLLLWLPACLLLLAAAAAAEHVISETQSNSVL